MNPTFNHYANLRPKQCLCHLRVLYWLDLQLALTKTLGSFSVGNKDINNCYCIFLGVSLTAFYGYFVFLIQGVDLRRAYLTLNPHYACFDMYI